MSRMTRKGPLRPAQRRDGSSPDTQSPAIRFPVVGIGASAGGLDAFLDLLRHLPDDTGRAFVFVQHLAAGHPSVLGQLLTPATRMRVRSVTNGVRLAPNEV